MTERASTPDRRMAVVGVIAVLVVVGYLANALVDFRTGANSRPGPSALVPGADEAKDSVEAMEAAQVVFDEALAFLPVSPDARDEEARGSLRDCSESFFNPTGTEVGWLGPTWMAVVDLDEPSQPDAAWVQRFVEHFDDEGVEYSRRDAPPLVEHDLGSGGWHLRLTVNTDHPVAAVLLTGPCYPRHPDHADA